MKLIISESVSVKCASISVLRDVIRDLHPFTQAVVLTDVPSINTFLVKVTDFFNLDFNIKQLLALILQTLRYTLELINKSAHPTSSLCQAHDPGDSTVE